MKSFNKKTWQRQESCIIGIGDENVEVFAGPEEDMDDMCKRAKKFGVDDVTVTFSDKSDLDAGVVWAPYVPVTYTYSYDTSSSSDYTVISTDYTSATSNNTWTITA